MTGHSLGSHSGVELAGTTAGWLGTGGLTWQGTLSGAWALGCEETPLSTGLEAERGGAFVQCWETNSETAGFIRGEPLGVCWEHSDNTGPELGVSTQGTRTGARRDTGTRTRFNTGGGARLQHWEEHWAHRWAMH
jgi:hypothetical protein